MKINRFNIKALALAGCSMALVACSENSWNDKLDGFKEPSITQVENVSYTLTDADYASIAGLSDNKALAGEALAGALKAVGTQHYFTPEIKAADYIPAFLSSSNFKYFTLSKGSSINVTYNESVAPSPEIAELTGVKEYVFSDEAYQMVYDSDSDYAASFSPSHSAAKYIPVVLNDYFDDAEKGDYLVVNYNTSDVDPVFSGQPTPPTPEFTMSNVLGTAKSGDNLDINGVVTAKCSRGYILSDASGSILVYSSPFDYASVEVGDQLVVSSAITNYGNGLQIALGSATIEKVGKQAYSYPSPVTLDPAYLATAASNTTPVPAVYGVMEGSVSLSGNYINIGLGSDKVRGSVYYASDDVKAQFADGSNVRIYGYFTSTSGKTEPYNCNIVVTKVEPLTKASVKHRVVKIPSVNTNALYTFDGSKWVAVNSNVVVLQPSDYTAMGQNYGNLSASAPASKYLPTCLKLKFPYAQKEDTKFVLYKYYDSGAKVTSYVCDEYGFDGSEWAQVKDYVTVTGQFVKQENNWVYDPSVTITLPNTKGNAVSQAFYQACVDWVYQNIDKPLGSTDIKSGVGYVTTYGNNEYYSGTSAYQCNVDLRAASAKAQYAAGYEGMSDEEVVALMKERLLNQVMPGALSILYPDATPVSGVEVIYTIYFYTYTGTAEGPFKATFEVTGKGEFKFLECSWNQVEL